MADEVFNEQDKFLSLKKVSLLKIFCILIRSRVCDYIIIRYLVGKKKLRVLFLWMKLMFIYLRFFLLLLV